MKTLTDSQFQELATALHDAMNPREEGGAPTWDCEHDHTNTISILGDLGLNYEQIEAAVEEFNDLGGGCDCEILLNCMPEPTTQRDAQGRRTLTL